MYTVMHVRLRGPNNVLILHQPDFPCLADEIAEPCPDMNIKVTAFTLSKNFYYSDVDDGYGEILTHLCLMVFPYHLDESISVLKLHTL